MARAASRPAKDRVLGEDDELEVKDGAARGRPAQAVEAKVGETVELEGALDAELLRDCGMAGINYELRRHGMLGAGFVSTAAGKAEDARGEGGGDLVVISVPNGRLAEVMDLLELAGVRRGSLNAG